MFSFGVTKRKCWYSWRADCKSDRTDKSDRTRKKMDFFPSLQDDVRVRLESDLVRLSSETSPRQVLKITEQTRTNYGFGTEKIALCHISHYWLWARYSRKWTKWTYWTKWTKWTFWTNTLAGWKKGIDLPPKHKSECVERGIVSSHLPPAEDVKKEERKVDDSMLTRYACYLFKKRFLSSFSLRISFLDFYIFGG